MQNKELPDFFSKKENEFWMTEDERGTMKLNYRLKNIISAKHSQYQHVAIVDSYDFGRCLVLDGIIQTTALDGCIYNEMISHVPLVTHPNPQNVLVIGGGDCGAANEVSKYDEPQSIDMVEIDAVVVEECRKHLPEVAGQGDMDKRVNILYKDGLVHVKEKTDHYDIAIIDSSDPVGPATKLFEKEFYTDVSRCLKEDGLMVCQSESPVFYRDIMLKTFNTLKELFPIVRLYLAVVPSYPGGLWSFTLASKKYDPLNADLTRLCKHTKYINQGVFKGSFNLPNFMREYIE
ncbi:MAG TPA: polyamine aminopropyltransferase [Clostridiales bacterium]|nr:polyamine aminopropyltransferase [Clostridiales bacterium]